MRILLPFLLFLLLASLTTTVHAAEFSVSAAASLRDVVNELSNTFVNKSPGVRSVRTYGASGALARQVEQGARTDIFIAANSEWLEYLRTRRLVDEGSICTFAGNTLVFSGAPGKATSMADLVRLERIAIGSPRSVPVGEYAMEALSRAGLQKAIQGKVVMAKDAREALMYADRKEVDGAFVYRTDARLARQAKILFTVPQELYPRVRYLMALTSSGRNNPEAVSFFNYLRSSQARSILARHGFVASE